ncbi:hypothetical protein F443_23212 [Phytophthora nicotianae P1569]|uniref:Uncharacterized protein n=1 Tax=Phytophthora nicotianae P1569 TaxID=1317065 RepID=V9DRY6_PHYNI|nr:hypothetical protein F443_23212 [Phytophthora nicotianae P1569]
MSETTNGVTFQVTTHEETAITERKYAKITLPRFSGVTAQDWLKWSHQFNHLCQLKEWTLDEKVVTTMRDDQGYITTERSSGSTMTKMSLKPGGSYQ